MPRSQRSGSPYCTRIASPDGVQSTAVSFGFLSSFLSSSVSTRSRDPSATDATYQPFLLVISSFDPSRENDTTENDSASSSPAPARRGRILLRLRRDRARLVVVDALHEHFALLGIRKRPLVVGPARRRGLERLRVEHGLGCAAARQRPHRVVGAEDHVVVGLLGVVFEPRHQRSVARELVVGDGRRRHHDACRAGGRIDLGQRATAIGAAHRVPIQERLRRLHDDGAGRPAS